MAGLAAVFAGRVYHIRRARVERQRAQLAWGRCKPRLGLAAFAPDFGPHHADRLGLARRRGLVGEVYRVTEDLSNAQRDLDETMKIATRSGMRLFEADAHLEYARLHLAMGDKDQARASLAAGRKIVQETGYHRRDGAVKELENQLA